MTIKLGNITSNNVKISDQSVIKIYIGNNLVWSST